MLKIKKSAKLVGFMRISFGLGFCLQGIGRREFDRDCQTGAKHFTINCTIPIDRKRRSAVRVDWNSEF